MPNEKYEAKVEARQSSMELYDAHCHPTDIMAATDKIAHMRAKALTIMATRAQDQDLVVEVAKRYPIKTRGELSKQTETRHVVPAFGWHPWFAHQMFDDRDGARVPGRREHYRNVLVPEPGDEENDFIDSLPEPRSLKQFLLQTEERLSQFPLALIGEIGLDRPFRVPATSHHLPTETEGEDGHGTENQYTPGSREGRSLTPFRVKMDHQKIVVKAQLELAAKYQRPVSVHSVATHGVIFDILQGLWKDQERPSKSALKRQKKNIENDTFGGSGDDDTEGSTAPKDSSKLPPSFPPRICLHSYSGPAESLKQFLNPRIPATIYFSFSQLVNFGSHNSDKAVDVIRQMPEERILIESDLHCAGEVMDKLLQDILRRVCHIKGWDIEKGAEICKRNWERFIFG